MAVAFVGNWTSAQFINNTGGSLAGRTSTAGNHMAIGYSTDDSASPSVTHSQAGSVQTAVAHATGGADYYGIRYVENLAGGASHTVTITTAGGHYTALHAAEHSGCATSSSIDQTATGTGTDTTNTFLMTAGATGTLALADEYVFAVGGIATNNSGNTWTAGSGLTMRGSTSDGSISSVSASETGVVTVTTAVTATLTMTNAGGLSGGSGVWMIKVATFKGVSSSTKAPPLMRKKRQPFQWGLIVR